MVDATKFKPKTVYVTYIAAPAENAASPARGWSKA